MYNVYKSFSKDEASERDLSRSLNLSHMLWLCHPSRVTLITKDNKGDILKKIDKRRKKGEISNFLIHYETGNNNGVRHGHWCAIAVKNDNVYFFDPLGLFPDDELKKISPVYRSISGQDERDIAKTLLRLKRAKYNIHYNDIKFQKDSPEISTCGRYCAMFFDTVRKYNSDPYLEMRRILKEFRRSGELYYDEAIVRWCKVVKKYGLM